MTATPGYRLDITCCFCGGSLDIDEAGRTVRCPHCASILRVAREGRTVKYRFGDRLPEREVRFLIEHHLKKAREPLAQSWQYLSRVFLPFWRITGLALTIRRRANEYVPDIIAGADEPRDDASPVEVTLRHKEVTFCAHETFFWGVESLGVRAQVGTLIPLEHDFHASHHLLPLTGNWAHAQERFERTVTSTATAVAPPGARPETRVISAEAAIIYLPLWVGQFTSVAGTRQVQFDPLARRVVALLNADANLPAADTQTTLDSVHIVPHRCPNCGADLPERARAVAFFCAGCRRLFLEDGRGYREHPMRMPGAPEPGQRLFPLWVFDLQRPVDGDTALLMESIKLLGFRNDRFLVPAFELTNPARLLRLVIHYNRRSQLPHFEAAQLRPDFFADVSVSPHLAARLVLPLTLAARALNGFPAGEVPALSECGLADPELVWLPYAAERYFWHEVITGASIERAAVHC